ncbi:MULTISPECIES: amidohydrolase family protein [Nocardia]|jgi:predicted TIM-barrel fold metal-dependent hydrolase|uniref:Amidohydrolase n=2 Tax=Nocardia TaxID=1817 RepID=A0A2T2ZBW0_9NOCA|nr:MULTISPECIES: amidohydrolase family protein [Nocardia]MDN2498744.1 amidohydrolase [Nocardia nova]PSR65251.1 amidohydrolase [Nocardia nova]
MTTKLWANSADSHFLEPEDLWRTRLPKRLAELVPRSEKDPDGKWETVFVDGQAFRRRLPTISQEEFFAASHRAPGSGDVTKRLPDLDEEGIWSELVFPSLGMWASSFRTPEVLREATRASNDWAKEVIMDYSPRLLPTAQVSTLSIEDACAELKRCGELGFKAVFLTVSPHPQQKDYNHDSWEPFWALAEDIGMVISFHIGTEPIDMASGGAAGVMYRGPGGAVLNYTETTFGGQRAVMKLVASGALDRHPNLKVLVSEGGATWVPFIADRMEEGYRQHSQVVRPKLNRSPKEIIYSQVYASFQHDESAVAAMTGMGFNNVMWGSDYPHMEGTYGHTQKTLHHLFDNVDQKTRDRIMFGAFQELFPDAPLPPAPGTVNPAAETV